VSDFRVAGKRKETAVTLVSLINLNGAAFPLFTVHPGTLVIFFWCSDDDSKKKGRVTTVNSQPVFTEWRASGRGKR
jgi:hypothetical protein